MVANQICRGCCSLLFCGITQTAFSKPQPAIRGRRSPLISSGGWKNDGAEGVSLFPLPFKRSREMSEGVYLQLGELEQYFAVFNTPSSTTINSVNVIYERKYHVFQPLPALSRRTPWMTLRHCSGLWGSTTRTVSTQHACLTQKY